MNNAAKPIIFLAFANDRGGEIGYLRNLPEEARQVHAILDAAAQDGLCEVVLRQNVTVEALLDVFQDGRYRNRIAVFHYGGHAESYELLLETAAGKTAAADAGGLAAFLSRQRGLHLIFLNGCSTQPQVQGLLDAGAAAVIATAQAIDDTVATDFAVRFYKGLAGGAAIATAFYEAEAACRTAHGGQPRGVYVKQVTSSTARRAVADRWPWALTPRPGAELVLQWNLPEAVNDPLFGLPPLPPGDLPESPFRNILWFRREDAPIFFGRGYDIRELYQRITAPDVAPIVLYYGQSGVGKSSLLAAGLLPRLEQVQTAVYTRRDQLLGLAGTLAASLPAALHPPVAAEAGLVAGAELLARWRAVEGETGKPLAVLLDQVEEVYTRPNAAMPGEMAGFLDLLAALFSDPAARPQGRLILSFRKEWLAEIEKLLAERQLPRAKVFLQRLEKRGIVEAVTGPARNEQLQRHFGLTVEPALAGEIADDLLSDPSSAVAPTLQILLSKMWRQAKARAYDRPLFDGALYQELHQQGLLLSDFLDQQLATLRSAQPAAVDSGLALDLLAFHTTPLGTAEQRTLAELRATYAHQAIALPDLLAACRDLYLLVDPAENRPDAEQSSRLAHDTLAPLVRQRFEESDAPGQRARRILESRAVDWENGKEGAPLDDADLAVIEAGRLGMRRWHPDEERLVQASHAAQVQRLAERQRLQQERIDAEQREQGEREARTAADARAEQEQENAGKLRRRAVWAAAAALAALILALFAGFLFNDARLARDDEAIARTAAETNEESAMVARATALANERVAVNAKATAELNEEQARIAEAAAVAAQAAVNAANAEVERLTRNIRSDQLTANGLKVVGQTPALALLLAVEGMRTQHDFARAQPFATDLIAYDFAQAAYVTTTIAITREAVTGSAQTNLHELLGKVGGQPLAGHADPVNALAFSADGHWLATASVDRTARLWDLTAAGPVLNSVVFSGHLDGVNAVAFSPDGRWLATASADRTVRLWDLASSAPVRNSLILAGHTDKVNVVAFSPDGHWLATAADDLTARLWDLTTSDPAQDPLILAGHTDRITAVAFSSDGRWLVTAAGDVLSFDRIPRLWDLTAADPAQSAIALTDHSNIVVSVAFSPDSRWLATASFDYTARLWDLTVADPAQTPIVLAGHTDRVNAVAFSPDSKRLATGSNDRTVRLWDLAAGQESIVFKGHTAWVIDVAFSPDNHWLATAADGGLLSDTSARLWDLTATELVANPVVLIGHGNGVKSVAFSPDSRQLATTASLDNTARLWDLAAASTAHDPVIARHAEWVYGVAFSPDNRWLATASSDSIARLWDLDSSDSASGLVTLAGHAGSVNDVAFSPDGRWLDTASNDTSARLWNLAIVPPTHEPVVLYGHTDRILALAFSPDGHRLATASFDRTVRLWDLTDLSQAPVVLAGHAYGVSDVAFSPDGRWLATASDDSTARLWDLASTDPAQNHIVFRGHTDWVKGIAFSPDGHWLATASADHTARLWDLTAADPTADPVILTGHGGIVVAVAFSPNGTLLATASFDNTARLWDLTAADPAQNSVELKGHENIVVDVSFSSDGRWLATASEDRTARLWRWRVDDLIQLACHSAGRNLNSDEWQRYAQGAAYHQTCESWPVHPSISRFWQDEARVLAQKGDVAGAVAKYEEALALDPSLQVEPRLLAQIEWGIGTLTTGAFAEGMAILAAAPAISPTVAITNILTANDWNSFCWRGALGGAAAEVMPACERAVALAPEDGGIRDSRGIARALTGDVEGAVEDFEFFVKQAEETGKWPTVIEERRAWIKALQAGENPFGEATLEQLRNE